VWTYHLKLVYFPHRAYTAVELRKKLHGKRFPPDIVEAVIGDFKSRCMADLIL
jgi:SOS response regulatory protein OraA/RecX